MNKIFFIIAFLSVGINSANAMLQNDIQNPVYSNINNIEQYINSGDYGSIEDYNDFINSSSTNAKTYCLYAGGILLDYTTETNSGSINLVDYNDGLFNTITGTEYINNISCILDARVQLTEEQNLDRIINYLTSEKLGSIIILVTIYLINFILLILCVKYGFKTGFNFFKNNLGKKL